MKSKPLPPQAYLASRFDYDPRTGSLAWLPKQEGGEDADAGRWNSRYAGTQAGRRDRRGYLHVMLDGHFYRAQRIVWRLMTGQDPADAELDFKDTDPANLAWSNLRLTDRSGNCSNARCKASNEVGLKGVRQVPSGRFIARIHSTGRRQHLGTFDTAEAAHAAYAAAARLHQGEFARPG